MSGWRCGKSNNRQMQALMAFSLGSMMLAGSIPLAFAQYSVSKPIPGRPQPIANASNRSPLPLAPDSMDPVNSVGVLKQTLIKVYGAYNDLKQENEALRQSIQRLDKALQQTSAVESSLQSKLNQDLQVLQRELLEKEKALAALKAQKSSPNNQQLIQLSKEKNEALSKAAQLEAQLKLLQAEHVAQETSRAGQTSEQARQLETLKQDLQQVQLAKSEQEKEFQALTRRLTETEAQLKALEQQQVSSSPSANESRLNEKNRALQSQLEALQSDLASLRARKAEAKSSPSKERQLASQIAQLQQEKSQLEQALKELQDKAAQYDPTSITAMEAKLKELSDNLEQKDTKLAALEASLNEANQKLSTATKTTPSTGSASDYQTLLDRLKESRVGLGEAVKTINEQNQRIAALNDKVEELQSQLIQASQKQAESLQPVQLAETPPEKGNWQTQYEKLNGQYQAVVKELSELRTQSGFKSGISTDTYEKLRDYEALKQQVISLNQALEAAKHNAKPGSASPYDLLAKAVAAEANNQLQQALTHLTEAEKMGGTTPPFVVLKAKTLNRLDRPVEVISTLEPLVRDYPGVYPEAYTLLARAYLQQNQLEKAERAYLTAMPLDLMSNYATLLKRTSRNEQAELFLKTALSVKPDDPVLFYNLGNLYAAAQRWDEAKTAYEKAIGLNQSMSKALYNLALVEVNRNQPASARKLLERYLQVDPKAENAPSIREYLKTLPTS